MDAVAYTFKLSTVLIVEDNPALADAVADVPGSMGYFAHDGDTALSEVKRSMPQVVILDLNCAPLTGWKWRVNYVRATAIV